MTQTTKDGPDVETDFSETPWLDPDARPLVELQGVSKQFGKLAAVNRIDLEIFGGELFTILGGSGSGKSTLLRMLAGFERPSEGQILIDGIDMVSVPPYERPVNMMFQSYALFPHMSVEQNVAYGLKKEGLPADEIAQRVAEMLTLVKLSKLAGRKPDRLSGGEGQRVALARALVKRPKLLLLDEPLAALDKKLREHTQFELMNLQEELGITFIVVTHDQEEAMTLSSRIAVMNEGQLEQVGTPGEVYEFPRNRFVADFVGNINLMAVKVLEFKADRVRLQCEAVEGYIEAIHTEALDFDDPHWLAIRPEKIFISKEPPAADNRTVIKGVVLDLGYFGNLSVYRVQLPSGTIIQVNAQNRLRTAHHTLEWDDEVYLSWDIASAIVLNR